VTGIVDWQQSIPGWANPKAFSPDGKSVVVLCGGQSIWFFDIETGTVKHEIQSADAPQRERWNDFAIAPQGQLLAIGGVDNVEKGSVDIWDFDGLGTAANSAPMKDGVAAPAQRWQLVGEQFEGTLEEVVSAMTELTAVQLQQHPANAPARLTILRRHVERLTEMHDLAMERYKAGQATQSQVLTVETELLKAQQQLLKEFPAAPSSATPKNDAPGRAQCMD
jgi:hypothetical protein